MQFSYPIFIFLFLPVTLGIYYLSPKKYKNILLLIASIVFYAWGAGKFTYTILGLILFNYATGITIESSIHPRKILVTAIVTNLSFLFYFKYSIFFINSLMSLLNPLRPSAIDPSSIYLPLAISFFVFHAISYNIDIYRKTTPAERNIFNLGLYLLFFPHLISGPILRYHNIVKQLTSRIQNIDTFSYGITRFIVGLSKKVIIADTLATVVDEIFAISPAHLTTTEAWLGIISFTLQVYFDFSGYSDMAIGLASLFGFKFPENFNYPYMSTSIREFWTRWHITLSSWFRDYLYIPLGGNRCSALRNYENLWIVFVLVGLWHGAGWNFIVWGAIHGTFMVIERVNNGKLVFWKPIRHLYTLLVVMIGWVFFRADSLSYAVNYLTKMFTVSDSTTIPAYHPLSYFLENDVLLCIFLGIIFSTPLVPLLEKVGSKMIGTAKNKLSFVIEMFGTGIRLAIFLGLLFLSMITVAIQSSHPFLYFKF